MKLFNQECTNSFISSLFINGENSDSQKGKLTFVSVGNKFKRQLEELMEKLR
jgi:myosin-6